MPLSLKWSEKKYVWTAAAGDTFVLEVRTNKNTPDVSTLVASAYGAEVKKGPRASHTAVAAGQTVTAVFITAALEDKRIELWEVAGKDEQMLTYCRYKPAKPSMTIQIN